MSSDSCSVVNLVDTVRKQTEKVYTVYIRNQPLICLNIDSVQRLCLAQISSTLLKQYSYNEIHNRRVALGITCVQCSSSQLELLRDSGAMPNSSRRCGTITYREAERLIKSFLDEPENPKLPESFQFDVVHHCGWGCAGSFIPSRYNSSRAKCIRCCQCQNYFSPNKFVFHCHTPEPNDLVNDRQMYRHPDAANFNAWRRHLYLNYTNPTIDIIYAWEDVKAMFNGGNRRRTHTECRRFKKLDPKTEIQSNFNQTNHSLMNEKKLDSFDSCLSNSITNLKNIQIPHSSSSKMIKSNSFRVKNMIENGSLNNQNSNLSCEKNSHSLTSTLINQNLHSESEIFKDCLNNESLQYTLPHIYLINNLFNQAFTKF